MSTCVYAKKARHARRCGRWLPDPQGSTNGIVGCYALHRDTQVCEGHDRFGPNVFSDERGQRSCMGDHFAVLEAVGFAKIIRYAPQVQE